jgi:hypothetical protein
MCNVSDSFEVIVKFRKFDLALGRLFDLKAPCQGHQN